MFAWFNTKEGKFAARDHRTDAVHLVAYDYAEWFTDRDIARATKPNGPHWALLEESVFGPDTWSA